eukprot:scaffold5507_cov158-Isochrysis_galbana.AAC.3
MGVRPAAKAVHDEGWIGGPCTCSRRTVVEPSASDGSYTRSGDPAFRTRLSSDSAADVLTRQSALRDSTASTDWSATLERFDTDRLRGADAPAALLATASAGIRRGRSSTGTAWEARPGIESSEVYEAAPSTSTLPCSSDTAAEITARASDSAAPPASRSASLAVTAAKRGTGPLGPMAEPGDARTAHTHAINAIGIRRDHAGVSSLAIFSASLVPMFVAEAAIFHASCENCVSARLDQTAPPFGCGGGRSDGV